MIRVEEREKIRRAYFIEDKSMREISRELGHSRSTVKKALEGAEAVAYTLKQPRAAPVLGPYKTQIDELLAANEELPRKQRYTSKKIYLALKDAGYAGSESSVRGYVSKQRGGQKKRAVYIPLEFDRGTDGQVDWGEAEVILAGEQVTVQLFVLRLCYSRRLFVRAYPRQKQEAFFEGHVAAFRYMQGIPRRLSYDNLKAAVLRVLQGHNREEQTAFIQFRSHYLFESHFCTLGQGHEKGRVEDGVGFARRNFLVPPPEVDSFAELNAQLLAACEADDARTVARQATPIGQAWQQEQPHLLALPARDYDCCVTKAVTLNGYSQVEFQTNRYSVPADQNYYNLVLKAYPFEVKILYLNEVIARHPRCYGHRQDVLDPLHYLPLLEQRPGAFAHAQPIRRWRESWPAAYERLLTSLQQQWPDGRGVREFVRILKLHQAHPHEQVARAVEQALAYGCGHLDGVQLCLNQLQRPETEPPVLDLTDRPHLRTVGTQRPDLSRYDQLLEQV